MIRSIDCGMDDCGWRGVEHQHDLIYGSIDAHGHGFIRHRRLPGFVIALAWRFGLQRFVILEVGEAPHDPDCTPGSAVTR